PPGRSTCDVGTWVLSASSVLEVARFLSSGQPRLTASVLLGRSGEAGRWVVVPLGTRIDSLLANASVLRGARVVVGGWFTGAAAEGSDAVVDGTTSAVWSFQQVPEREPIPCVRCGECLEICPVGLQPLMTYERITGRSNIRSEQAAVPADDADRSI